ncbi:GNAT family N-acetyltransferase [Romboutsia sp.]|uniref:GNAT family N-acetyltransferase n=1 Tax=Romboutsia sp. TaxID=1965302 RepID=UPI003F306EE2
MKIKFRELTEKDIEDFELIAKWDNQEEIKYFIRPNLKEGEMEDIKGRDMLFGLIANPDKHIYIILDGSIKVGYVSVESNFGMLYNKEKKSSWISICIGEDAYRDKGIGRYAMEFIEEKSRELNNNRIELGVFEYNEKAIRFYTKLGYKPIGRNKEFIYYQGRWHDDIRMEKYITI